MQQQYIGFGIRETCRTHRMQAITRRLADILKLFNDASLWCLTRLARPGFWRPTGQGGFVNSNRQVTSLTELFDPLPISAPEGTVSGLAMTSQRQREKRRIGQLTEMRSALTFIRLCCGLMKRGRSGLLI
jgi:hypothetical protein